MESPHQHIYPASEAHLLLHGLQFQSTGYFHYQPYFHQGIGMELDEILIDDTERFSQISKMINEKFRQFIYKGLAEGKEYFRFKYDQL